MSAPQAPQSPLATPMPWDLVAPAYEAEIVPVFEHYARDALSLAAPPPGSHIVDVACGPGTLALLAARAGHAVDAIDFSPKMIEYLEARKAQLEVTGIEARLGDGQALPYADGRFAAGFSMFGLMFFPDRARGFAELARVIAPGGRAVVSSWIRLEDSPILAAAFTALRESLAALLGPNAPKPGAGDMPLATPELCREEMSVAFEDIEVHRITHTVAYPSREEMWPAMARTMAPMLLLRRSLGEDKWATVSAAVSEAIIRAVGDGPPRFEMTALVSVGRRGVTTR